MRELIEEVLVLQSSWSSSNTPEMQRRGILVRQEIPQWLREHQTALADRLRLPPEDVLVEGRDGTGLKSELPWVRFASAERSPAATQDWYVVYLFDAVGDRVYLSLNQGTTRWDGVDFRRRPAGELKARVDWARQLLGGRLGDPRLTDVIALQARTTTLGPSYEAGNVAAITYDLDDVPDEDVLTEDALLMAELLGIVYAGAEVGLVAPGDEAPEFVEADNAINRALGRPVRKQGRGLSAPQRRVVELRAMDVCTLHFQAAGWVVKDVSRTHSYDLEIARDGQTVSVEVKGTTSLGEKVLLTRNEVSLARSNHPHTALAIVHGIRLQKTDPPTATDGVLRVIRPWEPDDADLIPLAYEYAVQPGPVQSD